MQRKHLITSWERDQVRKQPFHLFLSGKIKIPTINFNMAWHKMIAIWQYFAVCLSGFKWDRCFVPTLSSCSGFLWHSKEAGGKNPGKRQRHNILQLSLTPHMLKSSKQMCTRAKKNWNVCSDSYLHFRGGCAKCTAWFTLGPVGCINGAPGGCKQLPLDLYFVKPDLKKNYKEQLLCVFTWFITVSTNSVEI